MIFEGRNEIRYAYGCYGYTRGGGRVWHGGQDITGLDGRQVRAPFDGVVLRSRIVTDKSNLTWEWGNYVTVQRADGIQAIHAHLAQRLVSQGQRVKAGDVIGVMGSTGNAAGGYEHVHFEVRTAAGKAISPVPYSGAANAVGVYGGAAPQPLRGEACTVAVGPASPGDAAALAQLAAGLGLPCARRADGVLLIGPASPGDQLAVLAKAQALGLPATEHLPEPQGAVEVTQGPLNVRTAPGTSFGVVDKLAVGARAQVGETHGGWGYTGNGWVCLDYVKAV